jgi:CheY-like chemotaxis protein
LKIAVVDDSSSVRLMISMCLSELDVQEDEVYEFASAVEAIKEFHEHYYDVIFCDLNMPEMDGYDLIKAIYHEYPHLDSSRIVMVSGEEDASYKKVFKEFGVHHFIKKPIQPQSFLHHVRPLIARVRREVR